jgi:peptidoglycan hydrolase-like protein with peptidoglycan-binding domain
VAGAATLVAVVVIIALVAFSGHHRTTTGTTGPTGPTSPTGQSGPTGATQRGPHLGDRTLFLTQPRMRGSDVLELQHDLDALGFHPGPIDGEFGPQTRDAVSRFQSCAGLSPSGIVDGPTASAILQALPGPMACPSPTPSSTLATSTGPTGPT